MSEFDHGASWEHIEDMVADDQEEKVWGRDRLGRRNQFLYISKGGLIDLVPDAHGREKKKTNQKGA